MSLVPGGLLLETGVIEAADKCIDLGTHLMISLDARLLDERCFTNGLQIV